MVWIVIYCFNRKFNATIIVIYDPSCDPPSNKHSLAMGHTSSFMAVLTFADRTTWSFQGIFQRLWLLATLILSFAIIARSPAFIFRKCDFHFCLLVKLGRYSSIHFFQNMSVIACVAFHFPYRFLSFSAVAINLWFCDARPIKKFLCVKDFMSLGSLITDWS